MTDPDRATRVGAAGTAFDLEGRRSNMRYYTFRSTAEVLMNAASPHLLLVEDDDEIGTMVSKYLSSNDFRVTVAKNGRELDRNLAHSRIDLILLDLNLPGEDGLSICRRLRAEKSSLPIIMLTARGEEIDRVLGLEMGADDYLPKPFSLRELVARTRAVLRRGTSAVGMRAPGASRIFSFSGWRLDVRRRELLSPDGGRVALTGAEFDLLHAFCEHPGRVLSRDQLLDLTQGRLAGPFERSVDVLVSRLRMKLESDPKDPQVIKTIRSGGYLFTPEVETY